MEQFFNQFVNNISALLVCKINVLEIFNMVNFFQIIFVDILIESTSDYSQAMSTVTLNFIENLDLRNNRTYMKYLVLLKNNYNDF